MFFRTKDILNRFFAWQFFHLSHKFLKFKLHHLKVQHIKEHLCHLNRFSVWQFFHFPVKFLKFKLHHLKVQHIKKYLYHPILKILNYFRLLLWLPFFYIIFKINLSIGTYIIYKILNQINLSFSWIYLN
jgi:hypothetical protein